MRSSNMKRSRAADGSSKVSSFSTRLRSANTSMCGKRYSRLNTETVCSAIARKSSDCTCGRAIDLVEEERDELLPVSQQRTGLDARLAVRIDVGVINEVGRHQSTVPSTRSKLPPTAREKARRIVVLPMPTSPSSSSTFAGGEQRHADEPQRALLADDRLDDFLFYAQGAAAPVLQ